MDAVAEKFDGRVIDGRTSGREASLAIEAWNRGDVPVLVCHCQSVGHGANLQAGGRRIIWADLPVSGELWTQANGRLFRSGQKGGTVFCHRLICQDSIDERIVDLIDKKILNEENLLAAVQ